MSTVIEHVRHRVLAQHPSDERLQVTWCFRAFLPAHPVASRRDIAHHEPATSRCGRCYR
jgi:hypothetical protein